MSSKDLHKLSQRFRAETSAFLTLAFARGWEVDWPRKTEDSNVSEVEAMGMEPIKLGVAVLPSESIVDHVHVLPLCIPQAFPISDALALVVD
jgi:hypothetical protein